MQALGLRVAYILNTHTHHDHVAGNGVFHKGGAKLAAYREAQVNPDIPLDHGSVIEVGKQRIEVLFTPGHYLDSICLLVNRQKLITGDTLFVGCIGGSGFRGSSAEKQFHSLFQVILALDDAVEVYPGHHYGPTPFSTIGHERAHNPFLQRDELPGFHVAEGALGRIQGRARHPVGRSGRLTRSRPAPALRGSAPRSSPRACRRACRALRGT